MLICVFMFLSGTASAWWGGDLLNRLKATIWWKTTTSMATTIVTTIPTTTLKVSTTASQMQMLSSGRVQSVISRIPHIDEISTSSVFNVVIMDNYIINRTYKVTYGPIVSEGAADEPDFIVSSNQVNFEKLESSEDVCSALRQLKDKNLASVERGSNVATLIWRYHKVRSCVGL